MDRVCLHETSQKLQEEGRQRVDQTLQLLLIKNKYDKITSVLGYQELAALCGVLDGDEEEIRSALKPH